MERTPADSTPQAVPTPIHARLDCIGLFCPMPIVRVREAIQSLAVGEVIEMLADDPASEADMQTWTRRTGHVLLEISKSGTIYRFLVRKSQ